MWRHAFRPSSFSLLAAAGINIGSLIAGTFVVELLFALPGSATPWSRPSSSATTWWSRASPLVVAIAFVVLQFIIDFIFTIVDPRVVRE